MASNGRVAKVVDIGANGKSRKIKFKNKRYRLPPYGDYFGPSKFRAQGAELIDQTQYDAASWRIVGSSPAASPAPAVPYMHPSPEPGRSVWRKKEPKHIRFKEVKSVPGEEDSADTISDDWKIKIKIDTAKTPPSKMEAPSGGADPDPGQCTSPGSSKVETELLSAVEFEADPVVVAANDVAIEHVEDAIEAEAKEEPMAIFKRPKDSGKAEKKARRQVRKDDTVGAELDRKLRQLYKLSDLRERAFRVMCDENGMLDLQSLRNYMAHFEHIQERKTVKRFFEHMKPDWRSLVTFGKFGRAIDEDGDMLAAYKRFKATGKSKSPTN